MTAPIGLAALEARIAGEMETLAYPTIDWVVPGSAPDGTAPLDCAIIGAGMFGLAIGALLQRERVTNISLFDAAPEGREGPWITYARMSMLRTPKELSGPELGIPSLSFRAFWEAQHGREGWERLYRIPRMAWMDYLQWFRRATTLPVRNQWRLMSLVPDGAVLRLSFETPDGGVTRYARSVVLATGGMGSGGYAIPEEIARAVPADRVVHAMDVFDPGIFRGKRVGVLGAGASAFDLAISALESGAARAELCVRRPDLPRDNPRRWMETAGFLAHYVDLPDATKWAIARHLRDIGQPPPQPTFDAAMAKPGFALRTGFPWESLRWTGSEIIVEGNGRRAVYDHLAIAIGFRSDLSLRPELSAILPVAAHWCDRFTPAPGEDDPRMAAAPYLDRNGGFIEREPGSAPWLDRVLTITGAASLSLGPVAASVSTMKYVAPRLVEGVKRRLFLDQQDADWQTFLHGNHAELRPFAPQDEAA
jgi:cation diffusion facilitator CzcD-associated flavoprotein CzcO